MTVGRSFDLVFHRDRERLLGRGSVHASGIANRMEYEAPGLFGFAASFWIDLVKVHDQVPRGMPRYRHEPGHVLQFGYGVAIRTAGFAHTSMSHDVRRNGLQWQHLASSRNSRLSTAMAEYVWHNPKFGPAIIRPFVILHNAPAFARLKPFTALRVSCQEE